MENLSKVEKEIIGEIYSSSEAMNNLTILCDDFGGRLAGRARARSGVK